MNILMKDTDEINKLWPFGDLACLSLQQIKNIYIKNKHPQG